MTAYDHRQDGCATWTGNILTMAEIGKLNEAKAVDRSMGASPELFRDLLCTLYYKENRLQTYKMLMERREEEQRLERSGVRLGVDVCWCCLKSWDRCRVAKARKEKK